MPAAKKNQQHWKGAKSKPPSLVIISELNCERPTTTSTAANRIAAFTSRYYYHRHATPTELHYYNQAHLHYPEPPLEEVITSKQGSCRTTGPSSAPPSLWSWLERELEEEGWASHLLMCDTDMNRDAAHETSIQFRLRLVCCRVTWWWWCWWLVYSHAAN